MRQVIISIMFLCCADVSQEEVKPKKFCYGYQKIAADKGVDCNGDTIPIRTFREDYEKYLKLKEPRQ
jgi:hypothetical protein